MKYIGIDLGSSFIKAVLLDLNEGKVVESRKSASPKKLPNENPLIFEIPGDEMLAIVKNQIDDYTSRYEDIRGLIISTQMHGYVYSTPDREDRYVSWQDMRCMDTIPGTDTTWLKELEKKIPPEEMSDNGVYLKPSLGFCNLTAELSEDTSLPRNGKLFTLGSYIIYRLTGNHVCHASNGAPLGLVDVKNHCWDQKLIKLLGLTEVQLPRLADSDFEVCGTYESNGQILKVHPDYGDMQIAILGSSIGKGDVVCNVATGAQVIRYGKEFLPGAYEIRPFFENSYLYTISNMPAGRNIDVLIHFLKEAIEQITGTEVEDKQIWDVVHRSVSKDTHELKVDSCFYKNPYYPNGGAIKGINHTNLHIGNLFMAMYQDMAETYWKHIKDLGAPVEDIRRIICAGGACWRNPEMCKAIGEVSGKEQVYSPIPDEALAGMYRMSLVCSGMYDSLDACMERKMIEI